LNPVLRIAERAHYLQEIKNLQHIMRKSWKIIKEIINKNKKKTKIFPKILINGKLSDNASDIANKFNLFFTEIGPSLDKKSHTQFPRVIFLINMRSIFSYILWMRRRWTAWWTLSGPVQWDGMTFPLPYLKKIRNP
jgi:hypothetical protein